MPGGARREAACRAVGLSVRTWQRWQQDAAQADGRPTTAVHRPANRLSDTERQRAAGGGQCAGVSQSRPLIRGGENRAGAGRPREANISPRNRLSTGCCGPRTKSSTGAGRDRRPRRHPKRIGPPPRISCGAGRSPTWRRPSRGYSSTSTSSWMSIAARRVGLEVFEAESAEHATTVVGRAYLREGIAGEPLVLHSDNGAPMKGATLLQPYRSSGWCPPSAALR